MSKPTDDKRLDEVKTRHAERRVDIIFDGTMLADMNADIAFLLGKIGEYEARDGARMSCGHLKAERVTDQLMPGFCRGCERERTAREEGFKAGLKAASEHTPTDDKRLADEKWQIGTVPDEQERRNEIGRRLVADIGMLPNLANSYMAKMWEKLIDREIARTKLAEYEARDGAAEQLNVESLRNIATRMYESVALRQTLGVRVHRGPTNFQVKQWAKSIDDALPDVSQVTAAPPPQVREAESVERSVDGKRLSCGHLRDEYEIVHNDSCTHEMLGDPCHCPEVCHGCERERTAREEGVKAGLRAASEHTPTYVEGGRIGDHLRHGICSCGEAKADGVTLYRIIWERHIASLRVERTDYAAL